MGLVRFGWATLAVVALVACASRDGTPRVSASHATGTRHEGTGPTGVNFDSAGAGDAADKIDQFEVSSGDSTYGGVWLTAATTPTIVVSFTQDPGAARIARLRSMVPHTMSFRIDHVTSSLKTLQHLRAKLSTRMSDPTPNAPRVTSVGLDLATNRVRVAIDPTSPSGAEDALYAEYGRSLIVVERHGINHAN